MTSKAMAAGIAGLVGATLGGVAGAVVGGKKRRAMGTGIGVVAGGGAGAALGYFVIGGDDGTKKKSGTGSPGSKDALVGDKKGGSGDDPGGDDPDVDPDEDKDGDTGGTAQGQGSTDGSGDGEDPDWSDSPVMKGTRRMRLTSRRTINGVVVASTPLSARGARRL